MESPLPSPDILREIFLEKARLMKVADGVAENLFGTYSILYQPERKDLPPEVQALARAIDHTYLTVTPDNRFADVHNVVCLCREAGEWGTASVCVRPAKVALAHRLLERWGITDVAVGTVIDFPNAKGELAGGASPQEKGLEALAAQRDGATEFDVVIDYQAILRGDFEQAYEGIASVIEAVRSQDERAIVKTILETAWLREHGGELAIRDACEAAISGGTDFVKTSTGYATEGGATPADVILLTDLALPRGVFVKASGGIRTLHDALLYRRLRAFRLGMSASVRILEEALTVALQEDAEQ